MSLPFFGLDSDAYTALAAKTRIIFHLAANVSFDISLQASRRANVDSTQTMIAFAKQALRACPSLRLHYVSTAFVVGKRHGLLFENELRVNQDYWNAYEQTKLEAEEIVHAAEIPSTIYRPSLIIGESRFGRIRKFSGFYEFIKLAQRGKMDALWANAEARIDMVPADYVCNAMLALRKKTQTIGRIYHLVAGTRRSLTIKQLIDLLFDLGEEFQDLGIPAQRPRIIPIESINQNICSITADSQNRLLKLLMRNYLPYLAYERNFDVQETSHKLEEMGVSMAPISDVIKRTIIYAIRQNFVSIESEQTALASESARMTMDHI